jgi:eukaryotic-like serine/threonine-protein kinase
MERKRWQQVEQLYHAALERAPEERAVFLSAACAGDSGLRREVEELLRYDGAAESFIEEHALALEARQLEAADLSTTKAQLLTGQQLGAYRVLAPLGKGGMGEVYRAIDLRLDRQVAIKVLPAGFAQDGERLKRFEQEARATSALNHPNILTVHDIGQYNGAPYIVAELLEGEELRAPLKQGALPLRQALDYAQQCAAGLAAAHEKGVVHRDLKPENLFVTKDGRVKILDFGLAKLKPRPLSGGVDSEAQTLKPSERLTASGAVLGTVAYMSPEQVRGEAVDHRSDLFSFGLILFEMLRGERAFKRETLAETMTAILKDDPPELSETNAKISPQLEKLVRRCLEKKPERRFQTASDLGFALEALSRSSSAGANRTEAVQALDSSATAKRGGWRDRIGWIAAGVFALIAALALGVAYVRRPMLEVAPMRLYITPPENAKSFDWPTISPDGRTLAFVAEVDGKTQLWVRALGATTARPLVEVPTGLPFPFWSPDSQFLAYFNEGKLKKMALAGETPETLCETPIPGKATWNREGVILFGAAAAGIRRVSANGGTVSSVTIVDTARGEGGHHAPTFLPDGHHFLYYIYNPDPAKTGVYLSSLEGGTSKQLLIVNASPVGVALNPADQSQGYLTFERQGALLAQSFDFSSNQLTGNPVRIVEHVSGARPSRYSLASNGVLILQEGKKADEQLTWFDRRGKQLGTVGPAGSYYKPRLSPDGQRLTVGRPNPRSGDDIHLFDLAGGAGTPFTFDPSHDEFPIWSPDGRRIVWVSWREGTANMFQKAASGAGQEELLLRTAYRKRVFDWSADGRFILYHELNPQTSFDLWVLPMEGERTPWPWLNTPAAEGTATFSPDGKWIAYQADESGRNEIYLQAFVPGAPAAGGKRQLSTGGGTAPYWQRGGRELYYLSAEGKLMAVEITPGAELKAGTPQELFAPSGYRVDGVAQRGYTVTGDGQRFLFVTSAEDASVPPFTVVLNWMAEAKK